MIFKQTLEVNRIPPVRITSFHHHYVYLSGGNYLYHIKKADTSQNHFNIGSYPHRRHPQEFLSFQMFLMSKRFHLMK